MMPETKLGVSTINRLAENITILWAIDDVPEHPVENKAKKNTDSGRQLSIERERELADNLAYLSAWTDDVKRTMAVGIEEDADGNGMTVRLASNTGELTHVVEGFEKIAGTLEKAARRDAKKPDVIEDLLYQVVRLDYRRILSRLRSRHAPYSRKTAGRSALLEILNRAIKDQSIHSVEELPQAVIDELRSKSTRLLSTFSSLESSYTQGGDAIRWEPFLISIIIQSFEFDDGHRLKRALQTSTTIDPNWKEFLPQAIKKLGRYYSIVCDLSNGARNPMYTLFHRISIQPTTLRNPHLTPNKEDLGGFDSVLQRIVGADALRLYGQHIVKPLPNARARFASRFSTSRLRWKIHAEIQLLFYYEAFPDKPWPRIISSNKGACYLCNLFVSIHGKFSIPRTHGRIYEKWTIPKIPRDKITMGKMISIVHQFNITLEGKIVQLLSARQVPIHHPNESILFPSKPWSSIATLPNARTALLLQESTSPAYEKNDGVKCEVPDNHDGLTVADLSGTTKADSISNRTEIERPDPVAPENISNVSPVLTIPHSSILSLDTAGDDWVQQTLHRSTDKFSIKFRKLHLHVSWDCNVIATTSKSKKSCLVRARRLSGETLNPIIESIKAKIVDIDKLESSRDTITTLQDASNGKTLYLKRKDEVVEVEFGFENLLLPEEI